MSTSPATPSCLTLEREGPILTVRLSRPPVHALTTTLCTELSAAVHDAERTEGVEGLVLTGSPGMFSGGIDVRWLREQPRDGVEDFMRAFAGAFLDLYRTPLSTIAAISGQSPAGGCVLALACDQRVMAAGRYRIGLNEVAVGLTVPRWLASVAADTVGQRHAEAMLLGARMMTPDEALAIGLVDAVVPAEGDDKDAAHAALQREAHTRLQRHLIGPVQARVGTKDSLRGPRARAIEAWLPEALEGIVASWQSPACQAAIDALLTRMAARRG